MDEKPIRQRGNYAREDKEICLFCKFYTNKSFEEYNIAKSFYDAQLFDGRCVCMPHTELVKRDHTCGQFIDFEL